MLTHLKYVSIAKEKASLVVRFTSPNIQLKARDDLRVLLGDKYLVALNLAA